MHSPLAGPTCPRSTQNIILARHGESEYSARGLCNGDVTIPVALTERGRDEARRLGAALRDTPLELCVTSEFLRARETADIALTGRGLPRLVVPELNDPLVGRYEGAGIEDYRAWAASSHSAALLGPGGESRLSIVGRYARAFRILLARPEAVILVVCHSLPIAYAMEARAGRTPAVRAPMAEHATAYPFTAEELAAAADLLETWAAHPTW
jgi:broad specificity phosphatase PhoE